MKRIVRKWNGFEKDARRAQGMRLALHLKTSAAAELGIAAVGDYDQASSDLLRLAIRFVRHVGRASRHD
jgi:hypothetical protein